MRKVIILQARLASSRFPNKVIAELSGRPMIAQIIDRLKASALADEICAAIPAESSEDKLAQVLADLNVTICRGHPTDVLGRYVQAAYQTNAQIIVRATADNPFVDPANLDRQLSSITENPDTDYVFTEGLPVGVTCETLTLKTLEKLDYLARTNNHREHVTLYLRENPGPFSVLTLQAEGLMRRPSLSLTIDTPADFAVAREIYKRLQRGGGIVDLAEVIRLYDEQPKLFQAGSMVGTATA
jgi:spore coat polysaccharide biosynthesis protein SpsF